MIVNRAVIQRATQNGWTPFKTPEDCTSTHWEWLNDASMKILGKPIPHVHANLAFRTINGVAAQLAAMGHQMQAPTFDTAGLSYEAPESPGMVETVCGAVPHTKEELDSNERDGVSAAPTSNDQHNWDED